MRERMKGAKEPSVGQLSTAPACGAIEPIEAGLAQLRSALSADARSATKIHKQVRTLI